MESELGRDGGEKRRRGFFCASRWMEKHVYRHRETDRNICVCVSSLDSPLPIHLSIKDLLLSNPSHHPSSDPSSQLLSDRPSGEKLITVNTEVTLVLMQGQLPPYTPRHPEALWEFLPATVITLSEVCSWLREPYEASVSPSSCLPTSPSIYPSIPPSLVWVHNNGVKHLRLPGVPVRTPRRPCARLPKTSASPGPPRGKGQPNVTWTLYRVLTGQHRNMKLWRSES
ncbi:coiled-coil domain-containing protein 28A isoform X2 [Thunnus albacares]|uniref:coiled-coil domain-containing protein 28A isoform X2 n=1 Tax=Thunnus albacares TaxID=8236 RepID=UPI001CF6C2C0|nr:coiled-coil domain-containing protein 28A isoform X2 [Thunnus albacares]XP_044201196.1 coiled-coil domain-containing protein 28A isoform X2 [Thunnus albacares]